MTEGPDSIDTRGSDPSSLHKDAIFLLQEERKFGAFVLLLCTIDGLATRAYPTSTVHERFVRYLSERLPYYLQDPNPNLCVRGKVVKLEEIIYRYLRNPFIHESAPLRMDAPSDPPVLVDWSHGATYINFVEEDGVILLGGELIIEVLHVVIQNALRDDCGSHAEARDEP